MNYYDGNLELDQVIILHDGDRYNGECEGMDNKDIDVSKFRQLLDSQREGFMDEEIEQKDIGFDWESSKIKRTKKRTLTFFKKPLRVLREGVGLVLTTKFFKV